MATEQPFKQTARRIIVRALRKLGAVDRSRTPSAEDFSDGLEELNSMLAAWQGEGLVVPVMTLESFTLQIGVSGYTIGAGGTFDSKRPMRIDQAFVRDANVDYPVDVVTRERWNDIASKSEQGRPSWLYYDPQFHQGTVKVWTVPDKAYTLFIDSEKPFTKFTDLDMEAAVPEEWIDALVYNLAYHLSPEETGTASNPDIMALAVSSKRIVKRFNANVPVIDADPMLMTGARRPMR